MARQSKHIPERPRVALVGEGHTERIYFSDLKDTDRPGDIEIFPSLPRNMGDFTQVLGKAKELSEYYKVFALIDMDTVIGDGKLQQYDLAKQEATDRGIIVLENNPCFEVWLLLHFVYTGRSFTCCDDVLEELHKAGRLPNYTKRQEDQVKAKMYANHKDGRLHEAIRHARMLETQRPPDTPRFPRAEIFRFFEWYLAADRAERLAKGEFFQITP